MRKHRGEAFPLRHFERWKLLFVTGSEASPACLWILSSLRFMTRFTALQVFSGSIDSQRGFFNGPNSYKTWRKISEIFRWSFNTLRSPFYVFTNILIDSVLTGTKITVTNQTVMKNQQLILVCYLSWECWSVNVKKIFQEATWLKIFEILQITITSDWQFFSLPIIIIDEGNSIRI